MTKFQETYKNACCKMALWLLGQRYLTDGSDKEEAMRFVLHDLKLQVQKLTEERDMLKVKASISKIRNVLF